MSDKIQLTVASESLVTTAGETVETVATLHNLGQTIDQFTMSIEGIDASWYTLPVSSVALFPNDKDNLKIPVAKREICANVPVVGLAVCKNHRSHDPALFDRLVFIKVIWDFRVRILRAFCRIGFFHGVIFAQP